MNMLSSYLRPRHKTLEQHVPQHRLDRVKQSFRRRLSDEVEEVFYRAIAENDVRTAACLYSTIEDMNTRRQQQHGLERRISDQALARAREALERCRTIGTREKHPASDAAEESSSNPG